MAKTRTISARDLTRLTRANVSIIPTIGAALAIFLGIFIITTILSIGWGRTLPSGGEIVIPAHNRLEKSIIIMDASHYLNQTLYADQNSSQRDLAWSRDGHHIAFSSDISGINMLYIIDPDGHNLHMVGTEPKADLRGITWSPDSQEIAYVVKSKSGTGIRIFNLLHDTVRPLFHEDAFDMMPRWSPDGSQIAFVSKRSGNWELYTANIHDGSVQWYTDYPIVTHVSSMDWSPDGTQIAFVSSQNSEGDIFVLNTVTNEVHQLTQITQTDSFAFFPLWSPDGSCIAYVTYLNSSVSLNVARVSDGYESVVLSKERGKSEAVGLTWAGDNRHINFGIFGPGTSNRYVSVDVYGGNVHELFQSLKIDAYPIWQPSA